MGQQQLLLISLGVILVSIAVVAGINLFVAHAVEANRNAVVSDLTVLANRAQEYYMKKSETGGGNKSFVGFAIPSQLDTTANGTYTLTYARQDRALIRGVGVEDSGTGGGGGCDESTQKITHEILVYPTSIEARQVY